MLFKGMTSRLKNIGLILLITFFAACKSPAVLPSKKPIKDLPIKELTKAIAKNGIQFKKFRSRVKTTYDDGKRSQQLIINLRMEKDKSIWLSASMLVPIAKILITQKKVAFYEKFQKTFFEGDVSFINNQFNTDFDFTDLQNLLLGLPISDLNKGRWETISHPKYYILTPKTGKMQLRPTFFFDPNNFHLKEQRFLVPGTSQSLTIRYADYQRLEGEFLPREIQISLYDGTNLQRVTLEYTRVDFPDRISLPFEIPQGYKPIEL
tara:strand:- start:828 stop:1619 length:792 start_codon:yes stop_codon:yes gene_type:complete